MDLTRMTAAQEKRRRVICGKQRADDRDDGVRPQAENSLDPGLRVRVAYERRVLHHFGRKRRASSYLEPGREDDVVCFQNNSTGLGIASSPGKTLDGNVYPGIEDFQVNHFAVGLDQGDARPRFADRFGQAGSEIVRIDPPGRGPGFGELEAA